MYGIELPFDVPKENCMVIELVENGLKGIRGIVEYPKEFSEQKFSIMSKTTQNLVIGIGFYLLFMV